MQDFAAEDHYEKAIDLRLYVAEGMVEPQKVVLSVAVLEAAGEVVDADVGFDSSPVVCDGMYGEDG